MPQEKRGQKGLERLFGQILQEIRQQRDLSPSLTECSSVLLVVVFPRPCVVLPLSDCPVFSNISILAKGCAELRPSKDGGDDPGLRGYRTKTKLLESLPERCSHKESSSKQGQGGGFWDGGGSQPDGRI